MRRAWPWIGALLLAVLAGGWWLLRTPPLPAGASVPGGDGGGLPLAPPESENFDAAALGQAVEAARALDARAFIVARHGHVVAASYAHGFNANTVADAGGFATTLTALAGALALQDGLIDAQAFRPFSAPRMVAALQAGEAGKTGNFAQYLGENVWKPTNAAAALIAVPAAAGAAGSMPSGDCCFYARVSDWIRIGVMLLEDGRFEGTRILPAGMAARFIARDGVVVNGRALWLGSMTRSREPFSADGVFYMKGPERWRLWMLPTLDVAILLAAPAGGSGDGWDEARLPNLVTRAVRENPHGDPHAGIGGVTVHLK